MCILFKYDNFPKPEIFVQKLPMMSEYSEEIITKTFEEEEWNLLKN